LGTVEIFDSENGCFLQQFSWHASVVKSLIKLPSEIKKCVCAENSPVKHRSVSHNESMADFDRVVPSRRISQESCLNRNTNEMHKPGLHLTEKSGEPMECPLIMSLGYNMASTLNFSNQNSTDNVTLLTWTGLQYT